MVVNDHYICGGGLPSTGVYIRSSIVIITYNIIVFYTGCASALTLLRRRVPDDVIPIGSRRWYFFYMLLREIVLFYHHYFYSKPFEKILLVVVSAFVTRQVCSSQPVRLYVYYGSVVNRAAGLSWTVIFYIPMRE